MEYNADQVAEAFQCAAEENTLSPLRVEQTVSLPARGSVWIAGDLHDHRRNFDKLLFAADLANNPQRHLVLQEIVHGDHWDENGAEGSWQTLLRAAELKCTYPHQVHFLLANHDLAQIYGEGIMKSGHSVCEAFNRGVKRDFASRSGVIQAAITEFLLSFPLAVRTSNGLFFSHSVPSDSEVPNYDYTVFNRPLTGEDYKRRTGPVYQLIWGRRTTPPMVKQFLEKVGAQLIVTGHQPQETGFGVNGEQHLIIASDHNQGVLLRASLTEPLDIHVLLEGLRKFVAIDLPVDQPSP
ncbi:MAG: Calcineurin-like phosphoesterase superfamily domain protein [Phycisphaerales bacterium]|nr:Calcineurin-like phosphoesterase superfamily domain protein [Phycisphaerales bacterium]MDB5358599.1 Calcineurin-like phosphoesterase superfamily domain protein [Phycisphaerales bacterium]